MDWLNEQWNNPDLTCWYLMKVCETIALVNVKKGTEVDINKFKMSWDAKKKRKRKVRKKDRVAASKAFWMGSVGGGKDDDTRTTEAPPGMSAFEALQAKGKAIREARDRGEVRGKRLKITNL